MKRYSLGALAVAGILVGGFTVGSVSPASANADLEERIAELEATTVRKGNRKVSLQISGWVTQQVMWWDDGHEDNVYVTDPGSVSIGTHVKFSGKAQLANGWSAGYVMNIEFMDNDSLGVNQFESSVGNVFGNFQGDIGSGVVSIESSYWVVENVNLGSISVGKRSSAADNQAIIVDGSGTLVPANYVLYDARAFFTRTKGGGFGPGSYTPVTWGDLAGCAPVGGAVAGDCDGYPLDSVRYDSPTFGGFSISASWGEDDMWAASARWAGEFDAWKMAVAFAYNESTDETGPFSIGQAFPMGHDASAWQVGAYIQHVPTGLFVYGAYAEEQQDGGFVANDPEGDMWYVKAGIRSRWSSLGHTVLYGEYGVDDDKLTFAFGGFTGSELERYGVGIVQEIDAAAMSMWLSWRHYEGEVTCSDALANSLSGGAVADCAGLGFGFVDGNNSFEEFDLIKAGALINF